MSRVSAIPDPHSLARDELTALLKKLISREEVRTASPYRSRLNQTLSDDATTPGGPQPTRKRWSHVRPVGLA